MARKTKIEQLKDKLKKLKKEHDDLEAETLELDCDKCEELEYRMWSITDEATDIEEEIKKLKKK